MQIEFSVDHDSRVPNRFRGLITLRDGKDSITAETENTYPSVNGAWNEIITKLQRAVKNAERRARGNK